MPINIHNFGGEKGYGLVTDTDIISWQTLFVANMISVTDEEIPPYYYPNTIIDYKKKQYIDINYDSAANRPLWTYFNSIKPKSRANVWARQIAVNGTLTRIEFYTCKHILAGSELLLPYNY